jgi:DNA-binding YbaB/EbfC family protein
VETMDEILAQADQETQRIAEIQRSIERMEITGRSRNNGVAAKLRGNGQLTEVTIDPRVLDRYDAKSIGAFVVEAVNDAVRRLAEASQARYAPYIAEAKAFVEEYGRQLGE